MGRTSRIDAIKLRYELIRQEQLDGVLDSFRNRDQDVSTRGAGLLGFAGLMMASDLVFLSAEKASLAPRDYWDHVALAAVFVLSGGAWLAYKSLSLAADYSRDTTARAFLERWEGHLRRRSAFQKAGAVVTALGTAMFLLAMLATRLGDVLQARL
jgi:hypothetical protein